MVSLPRSVLLTTSKNRCGPGIDSLVNQLISHSYLLRAFSVPGTMLSVSHALSHLILKTIA